MAACVHSARWVSPFVQQAPFEVSKRLMCVWREAGSLASEEMCRYWGKVRKSLLFSWKNDLYRHQVAQTVWNFVFEESVLPNVRFSFWIHKPWKKFPQGISHSISLVLAPQVTQELSMQNPGLSHLYFSRSFSSHPILVCFACALVLNSTVYSGAWLGEWKLRQFLVRKASWKVKGVFEGGARDFAKSI